MSLTSTLPTLVTERDLIASGAKLVAGVDEVGRGAIAGPVTVGIVLVDASTPDPPAGLRDSKDLTANVRATLVPAITTWAVASTVSHASAQEVDKLGIIGALRLATHRGLVRLGRKRVDVILLDGNHDWLTGPAAMARVITLIKGDQHCAAIAAGSVIAKQERDATMAELSTKFPEYHWDQNKGYATTEHRAALTRLGPSRQHRRSWNLPI